MIIGEKGGGGGIKIKKKAQNYCKYCAIM